jgi:hypothetical protein
MKSTFSRNFLIFLLGFLSLGAFYGGISLIISPDGQIFHIPVEILHNSPFKDFLIPGLILLFIFGINPIYIIYLLLKKPESRIFEKFNLLHDHYFGWSFTVYIGIALVIWINIQTSIFNTVDTLHTIYSFYGILIICIALLPQTRNLYKK